MKKPSFPFLINYLHISGRALAKGHAWVEKYRSELMLLRSFEVTMYEPLYYQGFDPNIGFGNLPRSIAPPVPGETRIEIYRLSR